MAVHRKKMYVKGLWESVVDLGRSMPRLTTLAVMSLAYRRPVSASVMFQYIMFMVVIEDMFCFSLQMAIRIMTEAAVSIGRVKVCKNTSPLGRVLKGLMQKYHLNG